MKQLPCLTQQHQCQFGVGAALVKFVDDHPADPGQVGIGLQAPQEQAAGDHLQPGPAGGARFEPHAVADAGAHRFIQLGCQPLGRGLGGQPPGFEHHQRTVLLQQGQGDTRGLACTGRGLQQQAGSRIAPGCSDGAQKTINRQASHKGQRTCRAPSTG